MNVIRAVAVKNDLIMELTACPYELGEIIDFDTDKVRVTGKVIEIKGNWVKIRIIDFVEKDYLIV